MAFFVWHGSCDYKGMEQQKKYRKSFRDCLIKTGEDDAGNLIEIEVQIRKLKNFRKRLAFYASEMVANQAEPGQNWRYGSLLYRVLVR